MNDYDYKHLAELVAAAQTGDSNAFAELYTATYEKQYQYAYRYLRDEYLAQDALQEVYIAALRGIHTLKNPRLFPSWLNQINFRVCFELSRKLKRFPTASEEETSQYQGPASNETPEELVGRALQNDEILKQVKQLPYQESRAIIMKYYYEMPLEDIAEELHISLSSVKRYLASGRNRLQSLLKHL